MITERRGEFSENFVIATVYGHGYNKNGDGYLVIRLPDGRCIDHAVAMAITLTEYPTGSKVRFSTRVEPYKEST